MFFGLCLSVSVAFDVTAGGIGSFSVTPSDGDSDSVCAFLVACRWSDPAHPPLGVVTALTANRYHLYWLEHTPGSRSERRRRHCHRDSHRVPPPGVVNRYPTMIDCCRNVPGNVAWRFIADWLRMTDPNETDTLPLSQRAECRTCTGLSVLKNNMKRYRDRSHTDTDTDTDRHSGSSSSSSSIIPMPFPSMSADSDSSRRRVSV